MHEGGSWAVRSGTSTPQWVSSASATSPRTHRPRHARSHAMRPPPMEAKGRAPDVPREAKAPGQAAAPGDDDAAAHDALQRTTPPRRGNRLPTGRTARAHGQRLGWPGGGRDGTGPLHAPGARAGLAWGRVTVKVAPAPGALCTAMLPWWARTISRVTHSPSPRPP